VSPKFKQIVRRRRRPDEIPIARVAMRNFCLECVGYVAKEVELCTDPECWLFPWRFGKTPKALKSAGKSASGRRAAARLNKQDGLSRDSSPKQAIGAQEGSI